jgi:hypothetical protein
MAVAGSRFFVPYLSLVDARMMAISTISGILRDSQLLENIHGRLYMSDYESAALPTELRRPSLGLD